MYLGDINRYTNPIFAQDSYDSADTDSLTRLVSEFGEKTPKKKVTGYYMRIFSAKIT